MAGIKRAQNDRIFNIFNYSLMSVLVLVFLLPFFIVVITSVLSDAELARRGGLILWPEHFDFGSYKMLLGGGSAIYCAYGVTIFRVVVGTFLQLLFTCTMAYSLSKAYLPGRKVIITFIAVTMVFPAPLIAKFLLVKGLGLLDSVWALVIPVLINTWYLFIMKAFFSQIPASIEEAAIIDGCNHFNLLFKVYLPLSLPSIATIGLFYAVAHWNAWFDAAIFINSAEKLPVQNLMQGILIQNSAQNLNPEFEDLAAMPSTEALKCAMIVISTLPILCVYPFIQKYFVKGMMVGSVKE